MSSWSYESPMRVRDSDVDRRSSQESPCRGTGRTEELCAFTVDLVIVQPQLSCSVEALLGSFTLHATRNAWSLLQAPATSHLEVCQSWKNPTEDEKFRRRNPKLRSLLTRTNFGTASLPKLPAKLPDLRNCSTLAAFQVHLS